MRRRAFIQAGGLALVGCAGGAVVVDGVGVVRQALDGGPPVLQAFSLAEMYQRAFYRSETTVAPVPRAVALAFRHVAPYSATRSLLVNTVGATGWRLTMLNGIPTFTIYDGAGVARSRVGHAVTVGPEIHLVLGQYSAAGVLQIAQDRGAFVAATYSGFTPALATKLALGDNAAGGGDGAQAVGIDPVGFIIGDAPMSLAEWQAWCDSVRAAADVVPFPVGAEVMRHSVQAGMGASLNPLVRWTGDVPGAVDMMLATGTTGQHLPRVSRLDAPTWGWP